MKGQNNYKSNILNSFMRNKRGQLTLFVIIALVLVIGLLIVLLKPKLVFPPSQEFSPESSLRNCIEPTLKENLGIITKQGGYIKPEGVVEYKGEKIKYLCYTAENYKTCVVQQPMIKEQVEKELSSALNKKAEDCIQNLKTEYEKRGYIVSSGKVKSNTVINPGSIDVVFNTPMVITKGSTNSYNGFRVTLNSGLYDLLLTSLSIIDYESTYGDSETTLYLRYYPNLKIEKVKLSEGSKVYTLTNVITNESFRFASRSLSWPPGYGL